MSKPSERVAAGAALLDERKPGWYQDIDLNRLDVFYSELCVVGQVYGNYWLGLHILNLEWRDAISNGFFAKPSLIWFLPGGKRLAYDELNVHWRAEITKRRIAHLRREFEAIKATWTKPTAVTV